MFCQTLKIVDICVGLQHPTNLLVDYLDINVCSNTLFFNQPGICK